MNAETDGAASSPEKERHLLDLLYSRLAGQPESRKVCYQICHLLGALYEIVGPFYAGSEIDEENDRLTARWQRASRKGGDGLLPQKDRRRFFPERIDNAVLSTIAQGPADFVADVTTYLTQAATGRDDDGRELRDEATGTPVERVGAAFVERRLRAARKLVYELIELRKIASRFALGDALDAWTKDAVPAWPTAKKIGAQAKRLDRSAPPLALARAFFRHHTQMIDHRLRLAGRRRHLGTLTLLRARVVVALCALGLRKGTVRRLRSEDFLPEYELMPGLVVPALRLRHLKGVAEQERIFPIPTMVALWIQQYLDYIGERGFTPVPGQPLIFPLARTRWATHTRVSGSMIFLIVVHALEPFSNGRLYSPHTLRHLAEQYGVRAGADWLSDHEHDKDTLPRPSSTGVPIAAQTFADYLLDHTLHDLADRYGDRDTESARRWWRRISADGAWAYYWGDRGAPKGLDLDAVRSAKERKQDVTAELVMRRAKIEQLKRERDALAEQKLDERAAAERDAHKLDEPSWRRAQLALDAFNDRITSTSRLIEQELLDLPRLERERDRADEQLRAVATALVPIPDEVEPVLSIDLTELGLDESHDFRQRPILRREFDLGEFHWALGGSTVISIVQLRRYVRGQSAWQTLFDPDERGNPKGVRRPTPRRCLISYDDLPLDRSERYPSEVVERLEALLRQQPRSPARAA